MTLVQRDESLLKAPGCLAPQLLHHFGPLVQAKTENV
jgi:hypothetical protein